MKRMLITSLALITLMQSAPSLAKNNEVVGGIAGAVIGGVIGNQIGGGSGRDVMTGLGIIAGAAIGSSIGRRMDAQDQAALNSAQEEALYYGEVNRPRRWRGNEYSGDFYVTRVGMYRGQQCRSYRSEVYHYNGAREVRSGTTCFGQQGWYEVHQSYISWR